MPIANVIDLEGITPANLDLYEREYLGTVGNPPPGLLTYVVGPIGERMLLIEVWESVEDRDAFYQDRIDPATDAYLADGHPPLTDILEAPMTVSLFWSAGATTIEPSPS